MTKSMKNRPGYIPGLNKTNKLYNVPVTVIKKHFEEAINLADFLRRLGYTSNGTSSCIEVYLQRIGLNKDDLVLRGDTLPNKWRKPRVEKYKIEDIFINNSTVASTIIKDYVKRHNLIEYKCSMCGNTGNWQNKPLSLQLHHINGNKKDNRLENLTFVCPNCHSQTDTFTARNYSTDNKCCVCGKVLKSKLVGAMCVKCRRLNNGKQIKVKCVETGEVFDSLKDVLVKFDSTSGALSSCLKGKRKTAFGFHWEVVNDK